MVLGNVSLAHRVDSSSIYSFFLTNPSGIVFSYILFDINISYETFSLFSDQERERECVKMKLDCLYKKEKKLPNWLELLRMFAGFDREIHENLDQARNVLKRRVLLCGLQAAPYTYYRDKRACIHEDNSVTVKIRRARDDASLSDEGRFLSRGARASGGIKSNVQLRTSLWCIDKRFFSPLRTCWRALARARALPCAFYWR